MARDIQYTLKVDNQSDQAFDELNKNAKNSEKEFSKTSKKMTEEGKSFAKTFGDAFKNEIKNVGTQMGNVFKKQKGVLGESLAGVTSLVLGYVKLKVALAAVGFVMANLGNIIAKTAGSNNIFIQAINKVATILKTSLGPAVSKVNAGLKKYGDIALKNNAAATKQTATYAKMRREFVILADRYKTTRLMANKLTSAHAQADAKSSLFTKRLRSLTASLGATHGPVNKTADSLTKMGGNVNKVFDGLGKALGVLKHFKILILGVAAAIAGAVIAFKNFKAAVEQGDWLDKASRRIGFTVEAFAAWDHILKRSGSSMQEMESLFGGLSKRLYDAARGTGEARAALEMLNVSATNAEGGLRSNQDVFTEIVTKLSQMEDKATRNGLAFGIFGEQARRLIPALDEFDGNLDSTLGNFERFAPALRRSAAAGATFKDNVQDMQTRLAIFRQEALTGTIERINDLWAILRDSEAFKGFIRFSGFAIRAIIEVANTVIDIGNVIVSSIDNTINLVIFGIAKLIEFVLTQSSNLVNKLNSMKIIGKAIPDSMAEGMKGAAKWSKFLSEDAFGELEESSEKVRGALLSLIRLKDRAAAPSGTGETTPITTPEETTTTPTTPGGGGTGVSAPASASGLTAAFEQLLAERQQAYANYNNFLITSSKTRLEQQTKQLIVESDRRKSIIFEAEMFGVITAEEAAQERLDIERWKTEEIVRLNLQATQRILDNVNTVFQQIASIMSQVYAKQREELNENFDREKEIIKRTVKGRRRQAKAIEQLEKEKAKRQEELAKKEHKLALISAIINTAVAVVKALQMSPPPLGIAMAAIVGALGAVQIGMIASQAFAEGGVVEGPSTGDKVPVRVNGGEMILTRQQQAELFDIAKGNTASGKEPIQIDMRTVVQGDLTEGGANALQENNAESLAKLREMLSELQYKGEIQEITLG